MRRALAIAFAVAAFALLLSAAPASASPTYEVEGDGKVTLSADSSGNTVIVLTPDEGGEVLSFTVDGVEVDLSSLTPNGGGLEYVSAYLTPDSKVRVTFSDTGNDFFGHPLFPVILALGAIAAVVLFVVRRG